MDFAVIIVLVILAGVMYITAPFIMDELGIGKGSNKDKSSALYDLEGWLGLGVGFTTILMLLAAIGIFGYDFYAYVRIATSVVMLILIVMLLKYEMKPSLLVIGFVITLVLFNPIERIVMTRSEWIIADLVVAIILPVLTYLYIQKQRASHKSFHIHKKS